MTPTETSLPLLAAKLAAPSMPGQVVARPRLFRLLDQGVQGQVTLVAAPAGPGKSLLLASWAAQASAPRAAAATGGRPAARPRHHRPGPVLEQCAGRHPRCRGPAGWRPAAGPSARGCR